jgi:hypothetical protein
VSGGVWANPRGTIRAAATSRLAKSFVIASPSLHYKPTRTLQFLTYVGLCKYGGGRRAEVSGWEN